MYIQNIYLKTIVTVHFGNKTCLIFFFTNLNVPRLAWICYFQICYSVPFVVDDSIHLQARHYTIYFRDALVLLLVVINLTFRTRFRITSFHAEIFRASFLELQVSKLIFTCLLGARRYATVVSGAFFALNSY